MSRTTTSQTRRARFVLSRLERLEAAASRAYRLTDATPFGPGRSAQFTVRLKRAERLLAASYREHHTFG